SMAVAPSLGRTPESASARPSARLRIKRSSKSNRATASTQEDGRRRRLGPVERFRRRGGRGFDGDTRRRGGFFAERSQFRGSGFTISSLAALTGRLGAFECDAGAVEGAIERVDAALKIGELASGAIEGAEQRRSVGAV